MSRWPDGSRIAVAILAALLLAGVGETAGAQETNPIEVPAGFQVNVWTKQAGVSAIAHDDRGRMFTVSTLGGEVRIVEDQDGDGNGETTTVFASGLDTPLGLTFVGSDLFVSGRGSIWRLRDTDQNDSADVVENVVSGLPYGVEGTGQEVHQTNGMALAEDGFLYVSQGGTTNADVETAPLAGTVFRLHPQTGRLAVVADGFRNPYALIFHSRGALLATDNGADGLTAAGLARDPPEELNWVRPGGHYGHPYYFEADTAERPQAPASLQLSAPIAEFDAHSAAVGLAEWVDGDVFVALYSSQQVVRVGIDWDGDQPVGTALQTFATGFRSPLAVSASPDGSALYVSDYLSGPVYRITCDPAVADDCRLGDISAPGKWPGLSSWPLLVIVLLTMFMVLRWKGYRLKRDNSDA